MMSVREYAEDINKEVSLVLEKCLELDIDAKTEDDMLDEEAIIMLDNSFDEDVSDEEIEEEVALEEREMKTVKVDKKKPVKLPKKNDKKTLAQKKKDMYKSK